MERKLQGQTAVITGAGRGLGFATALKLAEEGASVYLLDREEELLKGAISKLTARGLTVHGRAVDVSNPDEVEDAFQKIEETFGSPSILANIAGVHSEGSCETVSMEQWQQVISVNLIGTFLCCRAATARMRKAQYGRIVNTASGVVQEGTSGAPHYVASKGGVIGLTRALASELGEFGITCNAVSPGPMATPATSKWIKADGSTTEVMSHILATQAIKRIGLPEDIANAVAFLASPDTSFVTGQILEVNGGYVYR